MFWLFVDPAQVASDTVIIEGSQGHHLARVLRVAPGERGVLVAERREHEVEVVDVQGSRVVARVTASRPIASEPDRGITLWQALLPNPDFDSVIQNATAVGVRGFVAVEASRSIARPAALRRARWQSIATSAAEQSHRGEVPTVRGPMSLTQALGSMPADSHLLVLDPAASRPLVAAVDAARDYTLAVGPEGGWTPDEARLMTEKGGVPVNLGPRILRARLAAVVATAILVQQR